MSGLALGQNLLGSLDVGDVTDASHGDVELLVDDGRARDVEAQLLRITRHHVLDVDRVENPAAREIRIIDIGFGRLEEGDDVLKRGAAFDVFVLADTEVDGHIIAHGLAHGLDELERKAHAVLEGSAVLVRTLVGEWREERAHEVAMRAVDEHHVETRVTQTHGRLAEEVDDLVHLLLGNFLEQLGVHIGREPRHPGLAAGKRIGLRDTPRMQDLARNRRAVAMHLLDKAMQAGNVPVLADGEAAEEVTCTALVDGDAPIVTMPTPLRACAPKNCTSASVTWPSTTPA